MGSTYDKEMADLVHSLEEQAINESSRKTGAASRERADDGDPKVAKKLRKKQTKAQIKEIFQEHNPAKLEELETIWEKYKGNEEALLEAVKAKYLQTKPEKITKPATVGLPMIFNGNTR